MARDACHEAEASKGRRAEQGAESSLKRKFRNEIAQISGSSSNEGGFTRPCDAAPGAPSISKMEIEQAMIGDASRIDQVEVKKQSGAKRQVQEICVIFRPYSIKMSCVGPITFIVV